MLAATGMMACPNLAVPVEVMRHVVDVESGANPYAIGVVGGQLVRQPKNLGEALATVHMLDAAGYNYSLGIAQVNRANLGKYGLDSYEKAFEPCPNLAAGAQILAACYASSGGDWGKAFSCYYSGNFTAGYRDGYVQKVYDSINRDSGRSTAADASRAIPLETTPPDTPEGGVAKTARLTPDSPGYRVAIRSVAFYATATSAVPTSAAASDSHLVSPPPAAHGSSKVTAAPAAMTAPASAASRSARSTSSAVAASSVFVPQVTGPNDPPSQPMPDNRVAPGQTASAASGAADGYAIPSQEHRDAAFVF
ncbi:lytic transglycosylase domain-containing protein [Rhodanobacter aciditrophus]|uniref:lytic transglycosylase domain-containing protein n=1 Tax=Rhodanobacter aciditrophus TaxID=1623218 RepID=UPI003CEC6D92